MKTILKIVVIIIFVLMVFRFCTEKSNFEIYISNLDIEFKDSYDIDSITQDGFTDWTLKAYIRISENDMKRILTILTKKRKFPVVSSEHEYYQKFFKKGNAVHGFVFGTKYFYGKYKPRFSERGNRIDTVGYQTYDMELDTLNKKLYFRYEYE